MARHVGQAEVIGPAGSEGQVVELFLGERDRTVMLLVRGGLVLPVEGRADVVGILLEEPQLLLRVLQLLPGARVDALLDQPVQSAPGARTVGPRSPTARAGTVHAGRRSVDLLPEFVAQRGGLLVRGPRRGQVLLCLLQLPLGLLYDLLRSPRPALPHELVTQLGDLVLVVTDLLQPLLLGDLALLIPAGEVVLEALIRDPRVLGVVAASLCWFSSASRGSRCESSRRTSSNCRMRSAWVAAVSGPVSKPPCRLTTSSHRRVSSGAWRLSYSTSC